LSHVVPVVTTGFSLGWCSLLVHPNGSSRCIPAGSDSPTWPAKFSFRTKRKLPQTAEVLSTSTGLQVRGFFECCTPYCHCQCSLQQVRKSVIAKVRKEEGWIIFHGDIEPPRCFPWRLFGARSKQLEFKIAAGQVVSICFFSLLSIPNNFGQVILGCSQ
jgi:hypothetical protein